MTGYVDKGDKFEDLHLGLYADADLAGDRPGYKSTMGNYADLQGPNTDFAFAARSKSIGGVCSSTPEAELAAANSLLKSVGMPTVDLMSQIRGTKQLREHLSGAEAQLTTTRGTTMWHDSPLCTRTTPQQFRLYTQERARR